jgi:hypothetical protein
VASPERLARRHESRARPRLHQHAFDGACDRGLVAGIDHERKKEGKPAMIAGELRIPKPGTDRLPAVVLVHGSGGVGFNSGMWEGELNKAGFATFVIDSFTGRGITNTITNQTQLSSYTMMNDAFAALAVLGKHPRIDPDKLSSSNLVLADLIEPVPMKSIGAGQFVIGGSKVRPRVGETFKQNEKLGVYMKLYNFGQDEKTRKPSGDVEYEVLKAGTEEKVIDYTEDLSQFPNLSASQVTVQKLLPLTTLGPGKYTIRLKVTDKIRNQVVTQSAKFTVI